ncbi:hypothetical protein FB645_003392 [Coemansia sp. IMI 203386]|nr:hypothetical protein FB645_003392 [Coemansia sp. IMI 203386]
MFNPRDVPDDLRHIQPYIQRGHEMTQADPVVSYFCQYYAARQSISSTSPVAQSYLTNLLDLLETTKHQLQENPLMKDETTALQHCKTFALRVFAKADLEDRQGMSSKQVARNFVVSSQFMQMLAAFGDLEEDVKEKIKYAKWRAAEILRAAREGRTPEAPPGQEKENNNGTQQQGNNTVIGWPSPPTDTAVNAKSPVDTVTSIQSPVITTTSTSFDATLPTVPRSSVYNDTGASSQGFHQPGNTVVSQVPGSPPPKISTPISAATFIPVPAANLPSMTGPDGELLLDPTDAKNAQKFSRWAISALEYDDVDTAIENLQKAIKILLPYKNK